ncbi:MAG TPA: RNA-binding protein [Xanthobacteraceae bacterium]|nr:RNA-binding protein [Xanthobacteraceae bacterium]
MVDLATGNAQEAPEASGSCDPHAVALGRRGGLKGGKARAQKLSAQKRAAIARKAAKARWSREPD